MHEYLIDKDKESKLAAEVSNLMDTKYRWNQGLIIELTQFFRYRIFLIFDDRTS